MLHKVVEPAIHYWGTPVVLVSTLNEDNTTNLAPISSAWWLGWSCMLGLDASSKTAENLKRNGQCVLNLASIENVDAVDRLAMLTGSTSVPIHKKLLGYRHIADKFGVAGLTPEPSIDVAPLRVKECPVQLEAIVENIHTFAKNDQRMAIPAYAIEIRIVRVHVDESILTAADTDRIDPNKWHPLLMSFRHFYGLGDNIHTSRLSVGPENAYAPWKYTGLKGMVGKALTSWTRRKHQE